MKRIVLLLTLMFQCALYAQIQQGHVRTAGKPNCQGTALQGVSIRVKGEVNTFRTDSLGRVSFIAKNEGDGYYIFSSIYKSGYELLDKDLIGRKMPYSASIPFEIVMISSQELLRNRQRIESSLRKAADSIYEKKYSSLQEMIEKNSFAVDSLKAELQRLISNREKQEKIIKEIVEKYSRADYDIMDSVNSQITLCIENGNLDMADSLIRSKGDIDTREKKIRQFLAYNNQQELIIRSGKSQLEENLRIERELMNSLANDYFAYFTICLTRLEMDSATYWIEKRANLDVDNARWQFSAGIHLMLVTKNYDKAISYFTRAISSSKSKYPDGVDDEYIYIDALARAYSHKGCFSKSIETYQQEISCMKKIKGDAYCGLAHIYELVANESRIYGDYPTAVLYLDSALFLQTTCYGKHSDKVAFSYRILSWIYKDIGNYSAAKKCLRKRYCLLKRLNGKISKECVECLCEIGELKMQCNPHTRASGTMKKLEHALEQSIQDKGLYSEETLAAYEEIRWYYSSVHDYNNYIKYGKMEHLIYQKIYQKEDPYLLNCIASGYYMLNSIDSSELYYNQSYTSALKLFKRPETCVVSSLSGLGEIYQQKGEFHKSIEMYHAALTHLKGLRKRDLAEEYDCLEGIARAYCSLSMFDSAQVYCDAGHYVLCEDSANMTSWFVSNLILQGDILKKQDIQDSKTFYEKALEIRKGRYGMADKYVAELFYRLAFVCLDNGSHEDAINYLELSKKAYNLLISKEKSGFYRTQYTAARKKVINEIKTFRK